MRRRVKNGIIKHYCDVCKRSIYDDIPQQTKTLFGVTAYETKRHLDFCVVGHGRDYCRECYETGVRLGLWRDARCI